MSNAALPQLLADSADTSTQKILFAANAAGIKLAVKGASRGAIPELRRGDQVLRYAGSILRHLGRCNEDALLFGSSFIESGQIDSWLDWAEAEFSHDEPPHLEQAVQVLDRHLQSRTFLVGQRLSLADISVSCSLNACQKRGLAGAKELPKAAKRWLGTCLNNDAFPDAAPSAQQARAASPAKQATARAGSPATARTAEEQPLCAKYSSCVGERVRIARILRSEDGGKSLIGQRVSVCGWVRTQRSGAKGALAFVELTDGSCVASLQVVIDAAVKGFDSLKESGTGASLKCTGVLVESPGKGQAVELLVKEADHEVVLFGGVNAKEYPLAKKEHGLEHLRSIAHLRPRSNIIAAVARVRSALAFATHEFFRTRGFQYVHTPLITAADCEGAGEMFQVTTLMAEAEKSGQGLPKKDGKIDYTKDFFGKPSFLTVSGQLSVENYCCALSNVYTFGPTFRAENSHTSRHLAEFWMIEPELAFADIKDDMDCAEDYLKYCVQYVWDNHMEELEFFDGKVEKGLLDRLRNILKEPFARVSYTEAVDILIKESPKAKFQVPVEWGIDLGSEHERWLTEKVKKQPTIVYNYPKDIKAFYMRLNEDNKTVAAMDLLAPQIGEVIGGSQREERLDVLDRRIEEMGLEPQDYWWYRDLRKFGSVPHSGFGLGFERLIMLCTGVENIRDVIPYPRYPGHAEF
eukprot:TRINITY_DN3184_c1_g1_i1.p1 TRINITY_DN3184_c1_g1~~TRINITY_DN3184_c1_g1_i1.p1  ORF type:complete len:691 (+),score=189.47 TRINITY_DN3184_c1_g1_i1:81-2153(+)